MLRFYRRLYRRPGAISHAPNAGAFRPKRADHQAFLPSCFVLKSAPRPHPRAPFARAKQSAHAPIGDPIVTILGPGQSIRQRPAAVASTPTAPAPKQPQAWAPRPAYCAPASYDYARATSAIVRHASQIDPLGNATKTALEQLVTSTAPARLLAPPALPSLGGSSPPKPGHVSRRPGPFARWSVEKTPALARGWHRQNLLRHFYANRAGPANPGDVSKTIRPQAPSPSLHGANAIQSHPAQPALLLPQSAARDPIFPPPSP